MSQFTDTVQGINAGETEVELSLKFKQLVEAVRDTGKKGSLTLKLTVEQNKKDRRLYELTAEVKSTVPSPPPQAAAYFMPVNGDTLVPLGHDPRQMAIDYGQQQQQAQIAGPDELPERYDDFQQGMEVIR